jgi:glycosyltransferase involved in cell wall biosynthesis
MNTNNLISIIIPTYNRASFIPETIESIVSQTYKDWECIIVDDGSTDDTEKVITNFQNKDSRIKFLKRPASKKKEPMLAVM